MIVAVDFDGVLCKDAFPEIGEPNYRVISFVRELIDDGHEVVLWTCRVDRRLVEAVKWCHDRGLYFCAVNDNAPSNKAKYEKEYPNGTRKVFADVYLDDKSAEFMAVSSKKVWHNHCTGYEAAIDRMIDYARKVIKND